MLRCQGVGRSCRFRVVLGDSSQRYPQFGRGPFKLRFSRLPSVCAPQWSPGSSRERNALAGEGARQCLADPDVPMTRLKDLGADALVNPLPRGLVGKEAVRLIRDLSLGDPEASAVGLNRKGKN